MKARRKNVTSKPDRAVEYDFTVLFAPSAQGGYVVTCPALPGLITRGNTLAEARRMAQDTIRAYLESLHKDRGAILASPTLHPKPLRRKIKVAIPA